MPGAVRVEQAPKVPAKAGMYRKHREVGIELARRRCDSQRSVVFNEDEIQLNNHPCIQTTPT